MRNLHLTCLKNYFTRAPYFMYFSLTYFLLIFAYSIMIYFETEIIIGVAISRTVVFFRSGIFIYQNSCLNVCFFMGFAFDVILPHWQ